MLRYQLLTALVIGFVTSETSVAAEPIDYVKQVKPLLAARCFACHGALQQKADLRVDTASSLRKAEIVVPGKSQSSPLLSHLRGVSDFERMPPPSEGEALTAEQIEIIRRWIDEGAIAPANEAVDPDPREHWAFRAPMRPPLPSVDPRFGKLSNPIDRFLAAEWVKKGLQPQASADRRLLLRRLTIDLTGLPPSPAQIDAFLKETSPGSYEKLVEELLASPQYGERWGRHFLDIWRYSDWWGLGAQVRNSQKHMWHWRDWVVENLNADTGYDEMIRQSLAADELYPADLGKLRATGYLARQYFLFNRTTWLDQAIEHTGKAFLGLTINCAKCHDHKYDPVRQDDYYRLRAFFEPYQVRMEMAPGVADFEKDGIPRAYDSNAETPTFKHERGDERRPLKNRKLEPGLPPLLAFAEMAIRPVKLPPEAYAPHLRPEVREALLAAARKEGEAQLQAMEARFEADRLMISGTPEAFKAAATKAAKLEADLELGRAKEALAKAEESLAKANEKTKPALKKTRDTAAKAVETARKAAENPGVKYTSVGGALKSPEDNNESKASLAKPFPTSSTGRRTALAQWIADARNPLTARVLVNHVWARHFGQPLVATVFDFGRKGAKPTHPELLDWLAVEFTEHQWSMKHLHRLIVTSQAYRMSSSTMGTVADNVTIDPENKALWRQNPARMEAQVVRDSLLSLAGKLDLSVGGPAIPSAEQDASRRRSLYFFQSHNEFNKFLSQFDDANVLECYRRSESIVPQQALTLANSKLALSMLEPITNRVREALKSAGEDDFITEAFHTTLGGSPSDAERQACRAAMKEWRGQLQTQKAADADRKARINLVGALINHNDFVTIR